jgi:hypothetical protein
VTFSGGPLSLSTKAESSTFAGSPQIQAARPSWNSETKGRSGNMLQSRMLRRFNDAIPADVKEKFMETFMETLGAGGELWTGGRLEYLEVEHGPGGCRVEQIPNQKDGYRGK